MMRDRWPSHSRLLRLQYNLDDEGWPYRSCSAYIAARDGGLLDVGEQQYFEGMLFQEAWVFATLC